MNILKASKNPNMMLQNLIRNNPQMREILNYINQNGGDPKAAFQKMAEEKGVNPDDVIKMLQQ